MLCRNKKRRRRCTWGEQELLTKRSPVSGIRDFCVLSAKSIGNPFFFCHHVKHFLLHRYFYFYAQLQFPGNAFSNWVQKGDHMSLITLALLNIVTDIANICWNLRDPRGRIFSYLPLLQLSACFPWNALFSFWSAISRLWFSRGLLKVVPLMRWEWRNSELGVLNWTKRKLIILWSSRGPVMLSN